MKQKQTFIVVLLAFLGLASCASFSYRFYVLRQVTYDGRMMRKGEDLPFANCSPSLQDASPCIVMMRDEAYRLKADFERLQIQLDTCQRNQSP